jgi:hypothetical protein
LPSSPSTAVRSEEPQAKVRAWLFASLTGIAVGAIATAAGVGRLFVTNGDVDTWARVLVLSGGFIFIVSLLAAGRFLRQLPSTCDDCVLYGRHIVGLTFVLLVTGLCNAAGMSTLALEGGLGFSAAAVIDAADPTKIDTADTRHEQAREKRKLAHRALLAAETTLARAMSEQAVACVPASMHATSALGTACEVARRKVVDAEDDFTRMRHSFDDADEAYVQTEKNCATARETRRRALFFLLSVSTMTSLLGAAFYVVNQVRTKRPRYTPDGSGFPSDDPSPAEASGLGSGPTNTTVTMVTTAPTADAPTPASAATNGNPPVLTVQTATHSVTPVSPPATTSPAHDKTVEPFDAHAFWSGAFFRIGEAVLFTFTFFWIIWSWKSTEYLVWLPVLALFVGMFVKTGETVIFRLGTRILFAADALLPAGPSPRAADPARSPAGSPPGGGTPSPGKDRKDPALDHLIN